MTSTSPVHPGSTAPMTARDAAAEPGGVQPTTEERAAAATVLRMIWGTHVSRALYAAAALGVADRLAGGPVSCAALARDTLADAASLYRVLRLLAGLGVFDEVRPRSFALTSLGDRLRSDAPASMRSWALMFGSAAFSQPFEHILHAVRTGQPGFDAAHGIPDGLPDAAFPPTLPPSTRRCWNEPQPSPPQWRTVTTSPISAPSPT